MATRRIEIGINKRIILEIQIIKFFNKKRNVCS